MSGSPADVEPCECTEPCPMAKIGLPGDPGCRGAEAFPDWSPETEDPDATPVAAQQLPLPGMKRVVAVVAGFLAAVFIVGAVILTWPAEWGGRFTLAGISGESMDPELHTNDLIIARRTDSYEVGDVVVYDVEEGGVAGRIIHRVIRQYSDGSFQTQGDNNEHPDPWHVQPDWILGEEVFMIPQGSVVPSLFRSPVFLGVLTAFLVAFLLWPKNQPEDAEEPPADDTETVERESEDTQTEDTETP